MKARSRLSLIIVLAVSVISSCWSHVHAQQPNTTADTLFQLLVSRPFLEEELPAGFIRPSVAPTPSDELLDDAFGGVEVTVELPDLVDVAISEHRIIYRVYATREDAERAVQATRVRTERLGGQVSTLSGFDYAALLLSIRGAKSGEPAAGSACLVNAGQVLVFGISILEQHAMTQADLNAADLAQAGVSHLDRLIAEAST